MHTCNSQRQFCGQVEFLVACSVTESTRHSAECSALPCLVILASGNLTSDVYLRDITCKLIFLTHARVSCASPQFFWLCVKPTIELTVEVLGEDAPEGPCVKILALWAAVEGEWAEANGLNDRRVRVCAACTCVRASFVGVCVGVCVCVCARAHVHVHLWWVDRRVGLRVHEARTFSD